MTTGSGRTSDHRLHSELTTEVDRDRLLSFLSDADRVRFEHEKKRTIRFETIVVVVAIVAFIAILALLGTGEPAGVGDRLD